MGRRPKLVNDTQSKGQSSVIREILLYLLVNKKDEIIKKLKDLARDTDINLDDKIVGFLDENWEMLIKLLLKLI